jgi:hypothetical protein
LEHVGTLRDQLEALVAEVDVSIKVKVAGVDGDHAAKSPSGVTGVCYESRDACSPGTPASDLADPQLLKDIHDMVMRDRNHPSAGTSSHTPSHTSSHRFPTTLGLFPLSFQLSIYNFLFSTFNFARELCQNAVVPIGGHWRILADIGGAEPRENSEWTSWTSWISWTP